MARLQTVTIPVSSNRGSIQVYNTTGDYIDLRLGGTSTTKTLNPASNIVIANIISGGLTIVETGAVSFDLQPVPSNAVIVDAKFSLYAANHVPTPQGGYSVDYLVIKYDWGAALTTGDWISLDTLKNDQVTYPLLGFSNATDWVDTSDTTIGNAFILNKAALDYIQTQVNAGSTTKFYIINRDSYYGDVQPTSDANSQQTTFDGASAALQLTYYIPETANNLTTKRYGFKVYNSTGTYLTDWLDVANEVNFSQEINSSGSEVRLTLARDPDSLGTDIEFNNKVVITCFDKESPTGQIVFQGYISQYTPVIQEKKKHLEVVLFGYGSDLNNFIAQKFEDSTTTIAYSYEVGVSTTFSQDFLNNYLSFRFRADFDSINSIVLNFAANENINDFDLVEDNNGLPTGASLIGSDPIIIESRDLTDTGPDVYAIQFKIPSGILLTQGNYYHFLLNPSVAGTTANVYKHSTDRYLGGSYLTSTNGTSWSLGSGDLDFIIYPSDLLTTFTYTDKDPAEILKTTLNNYATRGGVIDYGGSSIEPTFSKITYTFQNSTILELIQKLIELSPAGFYWYIDQSSNVFYLRNTQLEPNHKLVFGDDFKNLTTNAISQDVVNTIYFTGGVLSTGENFFKLYIDSDSIDTYGVRTKSLIDNRVTLEETADTIVETYLANNRFAKLRANLEMIDSSFIDKGYDIESFKLGQIVSFKSIGSGDASRWGIAKWGISYWGMNYKDLGTIRIQIGRITYNPFSATIESANLPVSQAKQLKAQADNIKDIYTVDNPDSPTIGASQPEGL